MKRLTVFLSLLATCTAKYPGNLFREYWGNQIMSKNLINLTVILCKDTFLKLRMADRVQEEYKHSMAYELGLLGSGIMDKFKHMLQIYRRYSNNKKFQEHRYKMTGILNAYHVMQSDYNELRAEKDLYFDAIDKYEKQKKRSKSLRLGNTDGNIDEKRLQALRDRGYNFDTRRTMMGLSPNEVINAGNNTRNQKKKRIKMIENNNLTDITSRKKLTWSRNNDPQDAEYKKKLRYIMWAERWKGFNPETEGVHIPDTIAKVGLANASDFLVKELKGIV